MRQPPAPGVTSTPIRTRTVGPIGKRKVGVRVAENRVSAHPPGLQDAVGHRHAWRLPVVLVNTVSANAIRTQTLEDRVLGELLGHSVGLVTVYARLPPVHHLTDDVFEFSVRHFGLRPRAGSHR